MQFGFPNAQGVQKLKLPDGEDSQSSLEIADLLSFLVCKLLWFVFWFIMVLIGGKQL